MKKHYFIIAASGLVIVLAVVLVMFYLQSREPVADSVVPTTNTGQAVECYTDADCMVGGCSGTVCAARATVADMVTTCEYRSEYACFAQDNCLCVRNRCNWEGNQQFRNCVIAPETNDPCAHLEGEQLAACQGETMSQSRCAGIVGIDLLDCLVGRSVDPDAS